MDAFCWHDEMMKETFLYSTGAVGITCVHNIQVLRDDEDVSINFWYKKKIIERGIFQASVEEEMWKRKVRNTKLIKFTQVKMAPFCFSKYIT